ncbi:ABC-F family ATP-binding cassette domain-containing protein [Arcanobacterium haemolyticum]|nr:ABC-F family ATP-binding cassette domain-containing protein [Arcanobacterium haemolyticum]
MSTVVLSHLSYSWPDGTSVLRDVTAHLPHGKTGVIGDNGTGKSTLLRLIAGELVPTSGSITCDDTALYLPQHIAWLRTNTAADLLGVRGALDALRRIESGSIDPADFDAVGDNWDIESRIDEALAPLEMSSAILDRPVSTLSGGEATLLAITGLTLRHSSTLLLDEPTNNLDRSARARLIALLDTRNGSLVVVSHDRELLNHMDAIAELRAADLTLFGGNYDEWEVAIESEQEAALQAARSAKQAWKNEKRQRIEAETKLARRLSSGKKAQREGGIPRIIAGNLARKAQNSASEYRAVAQDRMAQAHKRLNEAEARLREDDHIAVELPDPGLPGGRKIFTISAERPVVAQGPERIAVVGANGAGKTTLLNALYESARQGRAVSPGKYARHLPEVQTHVRRVKYLRQRGDDLDEGLNAMANVAKVSARSDGDIRNGLARLLIRGTIAELPVSALSGGERFRVALASILLSEPAAELLILDEPTNNLDMRSVDHLAQALDAYKGAILVVSHDSNFLRRIGVTTTIEVSAEGVSSLPELPE